MKKTVKEQLSRMGILLLGAIIYAAGVSLFLDPHGIAPGGLTGIAIILNEVVHWDTGMLVLLMNIPLLIVGWLKFGRDFLISTIFVTVTSSLLMTAISKLLGEFILSNDVLICAIAGGILMGIGMGVIFRMGGSTAGTDIIIKLVRQKVRYLTSGTISNIIDVFVVILAAVVYHDFDIALYSTVAAFVNAFVLNKVLYGTDTARLVYVVSDIPDQIAKRLLEELEVGVTFIHGVGAWSGEDKKVIMCVIKRRVFPEVKRIVREEDRKAFFIVSSANEIYGEGFKENTNIEL